MLIIKHITKIQHLKGEVKHFAIYFSTIFHQIHNS